MKHAPLQASVPTRLTACYHCAHAFEAPIKAINATCPACCKRLTLTDIIIKGQHASRRVETCGIVFVEKKSQLAAADVFGGEAVEVLGELKGNVRTAGHVVIGRKAKWTGDCEAPLLVVEAGAVIDGGFFRINADRLNDEDRFSDDRADEPQVSA